MAGDLEGVLPASAAVADRELAVGGVRASALAGEFGTPLVVYCERTMFEAAEAYRDAAPRRSSRTA